MIFILLVFCIYLFFKFRNLRSEVDKLKNTIICLKNSTSEDNSLGVDSYVV